MARVVGQSILLSVAFSFLLVQGAHAQGGEVLYWPVPGHELDVRGTFGDYRPDGDHFHAGIDIMAPVGTEVRTVFDELFVESEPTLNGGKGWEFLGYDNNQQSLDHCYYAHIERFTADLLPIHRYDVLCYDECNLLVYDFYEDGLESNDHLHFQVGQYPGYWNWRNPLWGHDNLYYPELDGADDDYTPPTIVAIAFAQYSTPNYYMNKLYGCTGVHTDIKVPDESNIDIIVYARDDADKVGVRALYYCVVDAYQEPDDWIPFCNFLYNSAWHSVDANLVFAFMTDENDQGCDVLTQHVEPPDDDRMWYLVTNTSGTANDFVLESWDSPKVTGDQDELIQTVWVKAVDAAGNADSTSVEVTVVPAQDGDPPATFWVQTEGDGLVARWERGPGTPVEEYRIWISCQQGEEELLTTIKATEEGETGLARYCVSLSGGPLDSDCVYRLEAVTASQVAVPLAWARAIR